MTAVQYKYKSFFVLGKESLEKLLM